MGPSHDGSPILDGLDAERAWEGIERVAAALREGSGLPRADLAGGEAGLAVFFQELWRCTGRGCQEAESALGRAADLLSSRPTGPGLLTGFAGVAWAAVRQPGGEPFDSTELDRLLLRGLGAGPWVGDHDLVNGLVGIGVHAIDHPEPAVGRRLLEQVLRRLAERAEWSAEGAATLRTEAALLRRYSGDPRAEAQVNLGLAHGMPGLIALLGHAVGLGLEEARPLLVGAVTGLLRAIDPERGLPLWIDVAGPRFGRRGAWCYGEPGAALALLGAARRAGEPAWEEPALELGRSAARRLLRGEDRARDAGLCHGAAGQGHLMHRLYSVSQEALFADAARYACRQALDLGRPGEGVGGWLAWDRGPDGEMSWQPDPGLLNGAAGIGLALLSALSPERSGWDRILLIDSPHSSRGHS